MDENRMLKLNDSLIGTDNQFDIDYFFEVLRHQMSSCSEPFPKEDLFKLFFEYGLSCTVEDIDDHSINSNVRSDFVDEFTSTVGRFKELFMNHYGVETGESDLSDLYKLYKVLVLNIDQTFAHFMAGLGTTSKYYTIDGSITPKVVDAVSGVEGNLLNSTENVKIVETFENTEITYRNLFDKCCGAIFNDNFFQLALLKDYGNSDLTDVSEMFSNNVMFIEDITFFSEKISKEMSNVTNYDRVKNIYFNI